MTRFRGSFGHRVLAGALLIGGLLAAQLVVLLVEWDHVRQVQLVRAESRRVIDNARTLEFALLALENSQHGSAVGVADPEPGRARRAAARARISLRQLTAATADRAELLELAEFERLFGQVEQQYRDQGTIVPGTPVAEVQRRHRALELPMRTLQQRVQAFVDRHELHDSASITMLRQQLTSTAWRLLFFGCLTLGAYVLLGLTAARAVRRTVQRLLGAARALASGDFRLARRLTAETLNATGTAPLRPAALEPVSQGDELTGLQRSFAWMAEAVQLRQQREASTARLASLLAEQLDVELAARQVIGLFAELFDARRLALYGATLDSPGRLRRLAALPGTVAPPLLDLDWTEQSPAVASRSVPEATLTTSHEAGFSEHGTGPGGGELGNSWLGDTPGETVMRCLLRCGGEVIGLLVLVVERPPDDEERSFLLHCGELLAVGLRNALSHAHLGLLGEELAEANGRLRVQNEELQTRAAELERSYQRLQAEHAARIQLELQLRQRAEELSQVNRRKDELLAMLGHELRNPLAAICGAALMIERAPQDQALTLRARGILRRQTTQMTRLLDDLLDVARLVHGRLNLQSAPLDLRPVIEAAVETQLSLAEQRQVIIERQVADEPLMIHGDAARIEQTVAHLLENAVKFSSAGDRVWIDARREQGSVLLRVRDQGQGISPALLTRLFVEPFVQAEQPLARTQGGLGVGLALARAVVQAHRGTIEARSDGVGRGAELTLRLPSLVLRPTPPRPELRSEIP